jgi:hypothetical protein
MLPLLDTAGAKMLKLEEVIGDQLELEGRALSEMVVKHVLTCFHSRDTKSPYSQWCRACHEDGGGYPGQRPRHRKAHSDAVPASS